MNGALQTDRKESPQTGVLLVQLGTPDAPSTSAVRRYLKEFLSDPRVIDIHPVARWLLLRGVILPFRSPRSAAAYRKIWTAEGSPLRVHSDALVRALGKRLGDDFQVVLGMRYGKPSIREAIQQLVDSGTDRIVVQALFPQYAASSTGSALERVQQEVGSLWNVPRIHVLDDFYDDPGFIAAVAETSREALDGFAADHVLLSYHGLPERQVRRSDPTARHCFESEGCCDRIVAANRRCYRAQCAATTRAIAEALDLREDEHSMAFQSRLGRTPWIRPYTDLVLPELHARGVRRLAVLCPSFVADCLETVEEIGLRAQEQWSELGGDELRLVPCVNSSARFVEALATRIQPVAGV